MYCGKQKQTCILKCQGLKKILLFTQPILIKHMLHFPDIILGIENPAANKTTLCPGGVYMLVKEDFAVKWEGKKAVINEVWGHEVPYGAWYSHSVSDWNKRQKMKLYFFYFYLGQSGRKERDAQESQSWGGKRWVLMNNRLLWNLLQDHNMWLSKFLSENIVNSRLTFVISFSLNAVTSYFPIRWNRNASLNSA